MLPDLLSHCVAPSSLLLVLKAPQSISIECWKSLCRSIHINLYGWACQSDLLPTVPKAKQVHKRNGMETDGTEVKAPERSQSWCWKRIAQRLRIINSPLDHEKDMAAAELERSG